MSKPLNVLLVDASEDVLRTMVAAAGGEVQKLAWVRVDSAVELEEALKSQPWDVVLCAPSLPQLSGVTALTLVQRHHPNVPVIVLSDAPSRAVVDELLKAGAHNEVQRGKAAYLLPTIQRELLAAEMRRRHTEAQRFHEFLTNSSDTISVLDATGNILYESPSVLHLLGHQPEELTGRNAFDLLPAEEAPEFRKLFAGQDGQPVTVRVSMRHRDGSWRKLEITGRNLLADPVIRGVILNARDISEQLRIERELQVQRDRLAAIMGSVEDVVWSLSWPELKFVYVSAGVERLLGTPADLAEQSLSRWMDRIEPADRTRVQKAVDDLATRRSLEVEYRVIRPDKETRWVRSRGWTMRNDAGEPIRLDGITSDITERKKTEEALRRSEERFQYAARATREVIRDWDLTTDEIWWNESVQSQFHHPSAQVGHGIGWWVGNLHPEDRERIVASIRDVIDNHHRLWLGEYRFRRGDGSYADIVDRAFVLRDQSGKPVRLIGSMMDVSERKKLEAKYLRAQRMETVGTLAGGVAHDLNNVLTPILLSVRLLQDEQPPEATGRMLQTIENSARRGAAVVKQLLTFARGIEGERVPLRVPTLLRELENLVHETFPKNIHFELRLDPRLWNVEGDATQLHQVLLNLCVNARDAMPDGGTLTVSAENAVIDEAYCAMHLQARPGNYVLLCVEDTGAGIPREITDRIFEPFFTTKAAGQGTGLGLSTVLGIVKSHRGFMDLRSEVNAGTRFNIHLPAAVAADTTFIENPALPPVQGHDECILLVDDEKSITQLAELALKKAGYRVVTAEDGAGAVAAFASHQSEIAAVVIDMKMPVMDGPTAVRVLRRMKPELKIIGASGSLHAEALARIEELALNGFISKPYTGQKLLRELDRVLRGGQPATPDERTSIR